MPKISIKNLPIADYPEYILLDTSMLLCLHPKYSNNFQKQIKKFLTQVHNLSMSETIVAFAPTIVFEECYFKIIQMYFSQLGPGSWHTRYKNNPRLISGCQQEITDFYNALMEIPVIPITINTLQNNRGDIDLENPMRKNIFSYSILPKDALIIAITDCLEIDNIATMDLDYLRTNHLNVYTV